MKFPVMGVLLISAALAGCQPATPAPVAPTGAEIAAIAEKAHNDYVAAINSNDTETLMALLTDDVVYQAPNMPEVVGKPAAREWVAGYFGAYGTQWEKTSLDFIVSGDWAFERYAYRSTDTDKATGAVTTDVGKGLNVYRRGADGVWRIARDSWSSNGPPPAA